MYFSQLSFFKNKLSVLLTAASAVAMMAFTSCASLDTWVKQANSPLPIEVQHSGSGQVMSFSAYETSDRLYVSGLAKRYPLTNTAHVDIQLIRMDGGVIAEKKDDINPVHPRPGGGKRFTDSYVASFPLSEARAASKIRVIYHSGSHS